MYFNLILLKVIISELILVFVTFLEYITYVQITFKIANNLFYILVIHIKEKKDLIFLQLCIYNLLRIILIVVSIGKKLKNKYCVRV